MAGEYHGDAVAIGDGDVNVAPSPAGAWTQNARALALWAMTALVNRTDRCGRYFADGEGKPGDLTMKIADSAPGHLHLVTVSDKSKIAHWLDWEAADICWQQVDATHTRVTWSLSFRRLLDPAWYFRPWERYAVRLAAGYLIEANAGPAERLNAPAYSPPCRSGGRIPPAFAVRPRLPPGSSSPRSRPRRHGRRGPGPRPRCDGPRKSAREPRSRSTRASEYTAWLPSGESCGSAAVTLS